MLSFLLRRVRTIAVMVVGVSLLLAMAVNLRSLSADDTSGELLFTDPTGLLGTLSTTGSVDTTNPFFQSPGTNGRTCGTRHVMGNAWSFTPANAQARFAASNGTDPLFRPVDGSNCPNSPGVNDTPPAQSAYSLLPNHGLIRIPLTIISIWYTR